MRFSLFPILLGAISIFFYNCDTDPIVITENNTLDPITEISDLEQTNIWPKSSLETHHIDSLKFMNTITEIESNNDLDIQQFTVYRNGFELFNKNFGGAPKDTLYNWFSSTKSITSLIMGFAIEDSFVSLNSTMGEIFPNADYQTDVDIKKSITIQHLITMTSGLSWDDGKDFDTIHLVDNPVDYILSRKMDGTPGDFWHYHSGGSHLLTEIVQKVTERPLIDYAYEKLFEPLGIDSGYWWITKDSCETGGWGLHLAQKSIAKIGQLCLNKGKWNVEQLISEDWINLSTAPYIQTYWTDKYAFHWWINNFGGYSSRGYMGQNMYIIPEKNLIIVFNSNIDVNIADRRLNTLMQDKILPSIKN